MGQGVWISLCTITTLTLDSTSVFQLAASLFSCGPFQEFWKINHPLKHVQYIQKLSSSVTGTHKLTITPYKPHYFAPHLHLIFPPFPIYCTHRLKHFFSSEASYRSTSQRKNAESFTWHPAFIKNVTLHTTWWMKDKVNGKVYKGHNCYFLWDDFS